MDRLLEAAKEARLRAHAPYSGFLVGAAVESDDGRIFGGCNVESASYGLTMCAERTALFRAVADGARKFRRMVVVTGAERLTPPCGACRQVVWELCGDIELTLANLKGDTRVYRMKDLLPEAFDASCLD